MTLITTQLQTFSQTHFKYAHACEHNLPDCSENHYIMPRTVYPGETFQVSVVAVGQRHGTVPS